jgi:mannose/fructose/N-acetylgalactosamine-specific phosphotransferase system component IID
MYSILWFLGFSVILILGTVRAYNIGYRNGYSQSTQDIEDSVKEAIKNGELEG